MKWEFPIGVNPRNINTLVVFLNNVIAQRLEVFNSEVPGSNGLVRHVPVSGAMTNSMKYQLFPDVPGNVFRSVCANEVNDMVDELLGTCDKVALMGVLMTDRNSLRNFCRYCSRI